MITILNIGNELCYGKTVNTNASFMASHLFDAGFEVNRIVAIRDEPEMIIKNIKEEFLYNDIIIMTGGLGPTKDDMTKEVIANYFGKKLVIHEQTLANVSQFFAQRELPLTEINKKQAEVPEECIVFHNANGTAPGLWMEKDGKILIALPGVPFEMKPLLENQVIAQLKQQFPEQPVRLHFEILTAGIGESFLSDMIEEWELALPQHITLAYLPSPGQLLLRITGRGTDEKALKQEIKQQIEQLKPIIAPYIISTDNTPIVKAIAKLLAKSKSKLAVAESCTGGYISHLITSLAGCSSFYEGGITTYSNQSKRGILNVRENNLKKHGAVSELVVNDMAMNTMNLFDVDYSIATSGIAGPGGGSDEKPVGFVWIAVGSPTRVVSQSLHLGNSGGREVIIKKAAQAALNLLRTELLKDVKN